MVLGNELMCDGKSLIFMKFRGGSGSWNWVEGVTLPLVYSWVQQITIFLDDVAIIINTNM